MAASSRHSDFQESCGYTSRPSFRKTQGGQGEGACISLTNTLDPGSSASLLESACWLSGPKQSAGLAGGMGGTLPGVWDSHGTLGSGSSLVCWVFLSRPSSGF